MRRYLLLTTCALFIAVAFVTIGWSPPVVGSVGTGGSTQVRSKPDIKEVLGAFAQQLPAAPLVAAFPSISRAGDKLYPLAARIGLALPEFDPSRMFLDLRMRLGFDLFDAQSLQRVGIDSTGPLYIVDQGPLTHPVYLVRLLPDGAAAFVENSVERLANLEELGEEIAKRDRGVVVKARLGINGGEPRFAYAIDGNRCAIAPDGCGGGIKCVSAALRPRTMLTGKARVGRLLSGIPPAPAIVVAEQSALAVGPSGYIRRAAEDIEVAVLAVDSSEDVASVTTLVLPSKSGKRRAEHWIPIKGSAAAQARALGMASLWFGMEPKRGRVPVYLPYFRPLNQWLAQHTSSLEQELRAVVHGGAALALYDLEPMVPGLDRMRSVDPAMSAYFVEHGLWVPTKQTAAKRVESKIDRWLKADGGDLLRPKDGVHAYAKAGRVVKYQASDRGFVVTTGPGTIERMQQEISQVADPVADNTYFVFYADAPSLRASLGRIGLLGHGENQDLRGIWVVRQAVSPLLARLGRLKATLKQAGPYLRMDATVEMRGSVAPRRR